MTTKPDTENARDKRPPEGAQPKRQSERENERIRKESEAESSGGGAERMDRQDEAFINSK
jgi:hypothetical protein